MLQNVFQLKADLKKKSTFVATPEIVQNDNVRFEIEVTDNGKPLALDNVQTVSLAHSTKGETVVTSGEIEGNKVIFNLGTLETKYVGQVNATVQLYDAEGRISTIKFPYYVVADPTGKDYVPSEKEQTLIEVVMAEAQAKIDELSQVDVVDLKAKQDEFTVQLAQTETELRTNIFSRKSIASIKKAIVFIDDDARIETFTRFKPIADEKGIKFSFCVITNRPGSANYMTWEQIKQMHNEGYDVLSHTHTHGALGLMNEEELNFEYGESKRLLQTHGINTEHIVYPGGSYSKLSNDVARKYYKSGIAIDGGINQIPIENYAVARPNLDTSTLLTLKGLADQLNDQDSGVLVFMMHTFNANWNEQKEQDLRDFIDYINVLGIDILTWNEAFDHFGNIVEVGSKAEGQYFKIDPYGNIHNQTYENIASYRLPRNSVSFNTPPSFFRGNRITITDFNANSNETEFPETGNLGVLETISGFDTAWQYWYPYQSDNIYRRRKHNTNSLDQWDSFRLVNQPYHTQKIDFGTIPAHSMKRMEIVVPGVKYGKDIIQVNPHGGLIDGIVLQATLKSGDKVVVGASNITGSDIVMPATQSFKFTWASLT